MNGRHVTRILIMGTHLYFACGHEVSSATGCSIQTNRCCVSFVWAGIKCQSQTHVCIPFVYIYTLEETLYLLNYRPYGNNTHVAIPVINAVHGHTYYHRSRLMRECGWLWQVYRVPSNFLN